MDRNTTPTTNDAGTSPPAPPRLPKGRWLYVLLLEGGYYYVGSTAKPEKRMRHHGEGRGAIWTGLHKPIEMIECRLAASDSQADCEKEETLVAMKLMKEHGFSKVRGGIFYGHFTDAEVEKRFRSAANGRLFKRTGGFHPEEG